MLTLSRFTLKVGPFVQLSKDPDAMAYLILMEGPEKGKRFDLTEDLVKLGRNPSNNVVIEGPAVSGTHCQIEKTEDGYRVTDLGSTNGTRVNNVPIDSAELKRSDIIALGTTPLMIDGDDMPAGPGSVGVKTGAGSAGGHPTRVGIKPRTTTSATPVPRPKDFGKRRDSRKNWIIVMIFVGLLILAAAVAFLKQVFL